MLYSLSDRLKFWLFRHLEASIERDFQLPTPCGYDPVSSTQVRLLTSLIFFAQTHTSNALRHRPQGLSCLCRNNESCKKELGSKVCFGFGALLAYSVGRAVGKTRRELIPEGSNAASLPHTVFPTARPNEYSTVVANR